VVYDNDSGDVATDHPVANPPLNCADIALHAFSCGPHGVVRLIAPRVHPVSLVSVPAARYGFGACVFCNSHAARFNALVRALTNP